MGGAPFGCGEAWLKYRGGVALQDVVPHTASCSSPGSVWYCYGDRCVLLVHRPAGGIAALKGSYTIPIGWDTVSPLERTPFHPSSPPIACGINLARSKLLLARVAVLHQNRLRTMAVMTRRAPALRLVGGSREPRDKTFTAKPLVLATLPHSDPGACPRGSGKRRLRAHHPAGLGRPQGPAARLSLRIIPRLLLFWIVSEAVRTRVGAWSSGRTLTSSCAQSA